MTRPIDGIPLHIDKRESDRLCESPKSSLTISNAQVDAQYCLFCAAVIVLRQKGLALLPAQAAQLELNFDIVWTLLSSSIRTWRKNCLRLRK